MGRLLILALVLAGIYLGFERLGVEFGSIELDGGRLAIETEDFEVGFARVAPVEGAFMVFGGSHQRPRNHTADATLATLALHHARALHSRHPDFHLCKSAGAARAQELTQSMNFIGANRSARRRLVEAVDLHAERVRGDGARTCISVRGSEVVLETLYLRRDGRDVSREFAAALGQRFYLVDRVELPDCASLLR
jgi:hypothetical protein